MTNQTALVLAVLIVAGIVVDYVYFDLSYALFLSRKFLELMDWVAFWR